jgi:hypothetical protein
MGCSQLSVISAITCEVSICRGFWPDCCVRHRTDPYRSGRAQPQRRHRLLHPEYVQLSDAGRSLQDRRAGCLEPDDALTRDPKRPASMALTGQSRRSTTTIIRNAICLRTASGTFSSKASTKRTSADGISDQFCRPPLIGYAKRLSHLTLRTRNDGIAFSTRARAADVANKRLGMA